MPGQASSKYDNTSSKFTGIPTIPSPSNQLTVSQIPITDRVWTWKRWLTLNLLVQNSLETTICRVINNYITIGNSLFLSLLLTFVDAIHHSIDCKFLWVYILLFISFVWRTWIPTLKVEQKKLQDKRGVTRSTTGKWMRK